MCAGLCMLVVDGGPAHHWRAADRHGHEAEACRALLNTPPHKQSKELIWCMVHNNSKTRWAPVVFLI